MTRLKYSARAFLRSLQISRHDFFIFVEGWTDRYFYDRICESVLAHASLLYSLRTAGELPGQTGGKEALLQFFSYIRSRRLLLHNFKGKKSALVFFVDKDIDDYLKRLKRSGHLIYTKYYSLENHLFRHCDLANVAAATASLDIDSVRTALGDQEDWLRRAATEWKLWVTFCITIRALGINFRANYKRPSLVNKGPYGGIDDAAVVQLRAELETASRLSSSQFQALFERTTRYVDRLFTYGQYERLFNGKWYSAFAAEDMKKASGGRAYNSNGLESRLLTVAASNLDPSQPWAQHFKTPLETIVAAFLAAA
jgi:hypothetical protein